MTRETSATNRRPMNECFETSTYSIVQQALELSAPSLHSSPIIRISTMRWLFMGKHAIGWARIGPKQRCSCSWLLPCSAQLCTILLLNHLPCRNANRRGPRLHRSLPQSGETRRQLVQRVTPLRFTQVGLPQTVAQCPGNRDGYCVPDLNIPIAIRESTHVQRQGLQCSMILLLISRAVTDWSMAYCWQLSRVTRSGTGKLKRGTYFSLIGPNNR